LSESDTKFVPRIRNTLILGLASVKGVLTWSKTVIHMRWPPDSLLTDLSILSSLGVLQIGQIANGGISSAYETIVLAVHFRRAAMFPG